MSCFTRVDALVGADMSAPHVHLSSGSGLDQLREAANHNAGAILSLPSCGMLRHYKSRLLQASEQEVWLESVSGEAMLIQELIATGRPVVVAFKVGHDKAMFASCVCGFEPQYRMNGGSEITVEALKLQVPREVKCVQRRAHYRAKVGEAEIQVRVWRLNENERLADRPPAFRELNAHPIDVSVGGLGVVFAGAKSAPPKIFEAERVRVELICEQGAMLLEGRVRRPPGPQDEQMLRCGIRWMHTQETAEGRRVQEQLTKLVAMLERRELRRARLGLIQAA